MKLIDLKQNNLISIMIGGLAALGGLTAFMAYIQSKKHKELELDILKFDREIKELTLYNLKNNKKDN
jgi:hypothetical protein